MNETAVNKKAESNTIDTSDNFNKKTNREEMSKTKKEVKIKRKSTVKNDKIKFIISIKKFIRQLRDIEKLAENIENSVEHIDYFIKNNPDLVDFICSSIQILS